LFKDITKPDINYQASPLRDVLICCVGFSGVLLYVID